MSALVRRWVARAGVRLSYQVTGGDSDRVLVLMAGYGRSGSSWLPWLDRVGPLPFRGVLVDHRGTGESARSRRPYTMGTLADDAAAVLGDAAGDVPAIVVGDSMGGMVALHLALRHPGRVGGLVLSAGAARGDIASLPFAAVAAISADVRVWATGDRLLVHNGMSAVQAHALLAPLREIQRGEPYSRVNTLLQTFAMAFHRIDRRLGEVCVPVEVLVGAGDRVLAPRHSRVLAERLPRARLTVLAGTGHAIAFERPMELRYAVDRLT